MTEHKRIGMMQVTRQAVIAALGIRPELTLIDWGYDRHTMCFFFTFEGPGLQLCPEGNAIAIHPAEDFLAVEKEVESESAAQ